MADPGSFTQLLTSLEQADFFIGVLPFVLTYVVFFLALGRIPLFSDAGGRERRFRSLVSVVLSLFVSYFLVTNPAYQLFFVDFFGTFAIGLVGLLGLLVAIGFTGIPGKVLTYRLWAVIAAVIAVAAWSASGGLGLLFPGIQLGPQLGSAFATLMDTGLIWGALIIVLLWWAGKAPTTSEETRKSLSQRLLEGMVQENDDP